MFFYFFINYYSHAKSMPKKHFQLVKYLFKAIKKFIDKQFNYNLYFAKVDYLPINLKIF